ncbi:MAG: hypothetical protein K8R31_04810 [Bacteroidales bacterium]|nr:hypothetical protein [Bacteroidales bacterium]
MRNISFLILTFSIYIISFNLFSQNNIKQGNLFIQNYNDEDYNTLGNQTWIIIQDQRGVMYFGNNDGVLEFDGNRWRLIEIPNKSAIRSLAIDDSTGRIYVGAVGDFGYLQPDSIGTLQYVSILDKVPEEYKSIEDVWQIIVLNKQIVFRTTTAIYLLKDNTIKVLTPDDRFHTGFCVNNQFYVREWGKGLLTLVNDSLRFIDQSEQFANERIYVMLPYENDKIFMVTRTQGVFIYSPNQKKTGKFVKLSKFQEVDNFIIKNQIYCGVKLSKDQFVLGTFQNGILIIDKTGTIIQHLNENSGLQNNMILSLNIDMQENIWAGLNNGISYIMINSPFTYYNKKNGLNGSVYTTKKFKGRLYAGTSLGLFCKNQQNNFIMLDNIKGQSWCLAKIQGDLFLGHTEGVSLIKDNIAKTSVTNIGNVWSLNKLQNLSALSTKQAGDRQDKSYILAGTHKGLSLLEYYKRNLTIKHNIKGFNESSRYMQIDNEDNVWISHPNKGIFRLKLNESFDSTAVLTFFNTDHGLPANTNNYVFKIKTEDQTSRILFGTEKGIYKYNPQTNYFVPDERFDILLNNDGYIDLFVQDEKGNIFFQQKEEKGVLLLQNDGTYKLERIPFLKFKDIFIENISIIDSTIILFCSKDGIAQYNPQIKPDYDAPYPIIVRQVFANDSLIFSGKGNITSIIKLPYKYNNLQFAFSALYYEDHDKTQYSYYMEGFDKDWSEWTLKTEKEYTNLHEGNYIFKVKAKNIYEKESTIAQYKFEILAPWYRTIMAYILYGIIAFIFIWFVVKFYTRRLKKEKENLEKIVKERTKDLHEVNTQLEEKQADLEMKQEEITTQNEEIIVQNEELETHRNHLEKLVDERTEDLKIAKEKAEESDSLKSAFLSNMSHEIRTPLNAIVGFSSLIKDPNLSVKQKNEISYHINQNSDTLLRLVDDIIDLSRIESGQLKIDKRECKIDAIFNLLFEIFNERKDILSKNKINIIVNNKLKNEQFKLFTDPIRLQQILSNLIDNALKFTEKGFVEYGCSFSDKNDQELTFYVKDTGIGLYPDQQDQIFNRFNKIEEDKRKLYRGTGLGLSISKNLVELLGGKLWVESEKDRGSTFYFTLPFTKLAKMK